MARTIYRAELSGWEKAFHSLDDLRTWANSLIATQSLEGATLKIYKSDKRGVICGPYTAQNYKEIVV